MSDAPERLWVWYDQEDGWVGVDEDVSQWDATEYVRADRIAALEAEVARLRELLRMARDVMHDGDVRDEIDAALEGN